MDSLKNIKIGLWCSDAPEPYYILDIKQNSYYRLFEDGSGSWQSYISIKELRYLTEQKMFNLKIALRRAFKRQAFDNLTYIEYLHRAKENERLTKSKKSV